VKDPADDDVVKTRDFCIFLKREGRKDIVKELRKELPSGMTGGENIMTRLFNVSLCTINCLLQ
jgi:hypothetical protein